MLKLSTLEQKSCRWEAGETFLSSMPTFRRNMRLGCNFTEEEFAERSKQSKKILTLYRSRLRAAANFETSGDVPESCDLREKNRVSDVRDQKDCGSCVAFGTIGAIEATYMMQEDTDEEIDLSEADLFFCAGSGQTSCETGWQLLPALQAMQTQGVVDEDTYGYDPYHESCRLRDGTEREVSIKDYRRLTSIAEMQEWISTKGGLLTAFNVHEDFMYYRSGIYEYIEGQLLAGHAVAIVGYDTKEECWICKNSWGGRWGEGGFFRIAFGQCGIEGEVYGVEGVQIGGGKKLAREFSQFTNNNKASGGRVRAGSFFRRGDGSGGENPATTVTDEAEDYQPARYVPIRQDEYGQVYFETERDLQEYCCQVLASKGFRPQAEVWVSEGLRADIVCDRTIYECKKILTRESLYQAFGQGASYLAATGLNRLVIVGQLPYGEQAAKIARNTIHHLERVNRGVSVSIVEEDRFWQVDQFRFGFQRWRIVAALVGGMMIALTGKQALLILVRWLSEMPFDRLFKGFLSIGIVVLILGLGLRRHPVPRWERNRRF